MGDNNRDASARRLRALTEHISPGQQHQSREYSQTVTGTSSKDSGINFSALSKLLPHDGPEGEAVWYIVVAAALMAFHQESAVGALWEHIVSTRGSSTEEEKALIARRIRESCLKASVLVGFPRVKKQNKNSKPPANPKTEVTLCSCIELQKLTCMRFISIF